jgi:hypothetical protein
MEIHLFNINQRHRSAPVLGRSNVQSCKAAENCWSLPVVSASQWPGRPHSAFYKRVLNMLLLVFVIGLGRVSVIAEDGVAGANSGKAPEATTYGIRNVKHQDLLRPKDANVATGTPIVSYSAQLWKCMTWRLQPAGESAFHLKNLFTSKTFSAGSDTSGLQPSVTQVPLAKEGGESPAWQFTKLDDGSYKITDSKSGKALTAAKAAGEYEVKIVVAPWQNLDEQKWQLEKMDPKQLTM